MTRPADRLSEGRTRWLTRPRRRGTLAGMAAGYLSRMNYGSLPAARALVDAAWDPLDPPPSRDDPQRAVLVRVMCAMYLRTGRMDFMRGYVQAIQERLAREGMPVPRGHTIRWYRSRLSTDPGEFETTPGVDVATLRRIELRYLR